MIRTGDEYRESIRDGREVWIDGERVDDVTTHPMFKPLVDVRARIFDMAHDETTRDTMTYLDAGSGRAQRDRPQAAALAGGLGGQAPRGGRGHGRRRRRGDPGRGRDGRRDVVAVRRPGRPQRGRPPVRREHPQPRPASRHRRPVPRLGQHRPQGRPVEAAAGPGSRHAAACRLRDGQRDRRPRRQVRDGCRLRQPGVRQAHHRQLGRRGAVRLRRSDSSARWEHGVSGTSAAPALPAGDRQPTIRWPTGSTRSTPWWCSTTWRSRGRTSSSTATRGRRPSSGRPSTATAPSRSCSGSCARPTC